MTQLLRTITFAILIFDITSQIVTLRLPDHTDRIRINNIKRQKFMEKIYPEDLQEIEEIYPKDPFHVSWIIIILLVILFILLISNYFHRLRRYVRNIYAGFRNFGLRYNLRHRYVGRPRAQPIIVYQNERPTVTIDIPD